MPHLAVRIAPKLARQSLGKQAIDLTRKDFQSTADYNIEIVPASDTGAVEMALRTSSVTTASIWSHGKASVPAG